jgi:hypothetical protein
MKNKDKGRLPPFVPLLKDTLDSPAWKATSMGARILYIALKRRYNLQSQNNGRLYLANRKAAAEIRSSPNQIVRWFRELQYYGFIVMQTPGGLGVYGKGRAPCWRLTEVGYMKEPPTRDFERWNGVRFGQRKKQKPVTENRNAPLRKTVTPPLRKTVTLHGTSVTENRNKGSGQSVTENRNKSRLTTRVVRGRGLTEEANPPNLPLMTVLEGGKGDSRTEGSKEVCAHCGRNGSIFKYKNAGRPLWLHRPCRRYWLQARGVAS